MPHRQKVLELLEKARPENSTEAAERHVFRMFVQENEDCFERTCLKGHITANGWIVSPDFSHVLLNHHRAHDMWMQFGGHLDGETDVRAAALRECQEETGLQSIQILDEMPFDIGLHYMPTYKGVEEHVHFSVCFLCVADMQESLLHSERESVDIKWVPLHEVQNYIAADDLPCQRFLAKTQKMAKLRAA